MSRRIICDGCDKDLTNVGEHARVEVAASIEQKTIGRTIVGPKTLNLDLCLSCSSMFNRYIDPSKWVRHDPRSA